MGTSGKYAATVARHRAMLDSSDASGQTKDALHALLDVGVRAINGSTDKIQDLTEMSLLSHLYQVDKAVQDARDKQELADELRKEIEKTARVNKESANTLTAYINARRDTCPYKVSTIVGKWAWLYPFRWPMTVGFCVSVFAISLSPHAVEIVSLITKVWK